MASDQQTAPTSALYEGWVMHRRLSPRHHRFKYRVFAMLLELDELSALDRKLTLFKYNRWGLFSFQDRDHGDGRALTLWLNDLLAQNGIEAKGARRVLCYPRILGFVFNPISVWFCDDERGRLQAIVYEVHNTLPSSPDDFLRRVWNYRWCLHYTSQRNRKTSLPATRKSDSNLRCI